MSNYAKGTDFAAKDDLTSGDPDKIVRGTEIDDEFNAIAAAVSTKRDTTSIVTAQYGGTGLSSPGTSGNILVSNGTGWVSQASGASLLGTTSNASPYNSYYGFQAGNATTTGEANTLLGFQSGKNVTAGQNITAIGTYSGWNLTAASSGTNIAIGQSAFSNTSSAVVNAGTANIAIGTETYRAATGVDSCIAIGHLSQYNSIAGEYNIGIGLRSLGAAYNGADYNIGIGNDTLDALTNGQKNIGIGEEASGAVTGGFYNVGLGALSLAAVTTGSSNTALGYGSLPTGNFNGMTGVGTGASCTGSDQVQLGNSSSTPYAYAALQLRSDLRDKADVKDTALGLSFVNALRPVDFKWDMREDYRTPRPVKADYATNEEFNNAVAQWEEASKLNNLTHDGTHTRNRYHHGLIAQEVKDVMTNLSVDFAGYQDHKVNGGDDVYSIGYTELIGPMIKAIQELKVELDSAKARITALEAA